MLAVAALAPAALAAQRSEAVYRTPGDSANNAYRIYHAPGTPRALLVLIPGYGSGIDSYSASGYTPSTLPERLADRGVVSVLLEGGPTVAASFLAAGLVDRVVGYVAPALLGAGPSAVGDLGVGTIVEALRLRLDEVVRFGDDVRLTLTPTQRSA